MPTYSLDTNILIDFFKKKPYTIPYVGQPKKFLISYVVIGEILQGAINKSELNLYSQSFSKILINHGSTTISTRALQILQDFTLNHGINLFDAIIAATAIETDTTLVTLNHKHFSPIKHLRLLNPLQP